MVSEGMVMRASVCGVLLCLILSRPAAAGTEPEADQIIEQMDRLKDDAFCLMINGFVVREKSLFMAGLLASKELEEPGSMIDQVLDPLLEDARLLSFDSKMIRNKLLSWGVNMDQVDETVSAAVQKEASQNLTLWTNAIGMQGATTYLNLLAAKQRYCKNYLTKIGNKV
jgi:hypothetical protein